jgi:hypothetical protein
MIKARRLCLSAPMRGKSFGAVEPGQPPSEQGPVRPGDHTPAQPKLGGFIIFAEKITRVMQLLLPTAQGGRPASMPGPVQRPRSPALVPSAPVRGSMLIEAGLNVPFLPTTGRNVIFQWLSAALPAWGNVGATWHAARRA